MDRNSFLPQSSLVIVRLIFLGTGGYHPNARRHTAGVLLPDAGVLFDAGTGTFRVQELLKSPELRIFLTHAHLDHICGMTYLLVPLMTGQIQKCTVHAEPAVLDAIEQHLFDPAIFPVRPKFDFVPLIVGQTLQFQTPSGTATVRSRSLNHPGGSIGFRFSLGSSEFAYLTDTTVRADVCEFVRGSKLLIHECYFADEHKEWCDPTGHSHTSAVANFARTANVQRLLLTHVDPQRPNDDPIGIATARSIFPATDLAEDLMEVEF